jgi:hypothetical protein
MIASMRVLPLAILIAALAVLNLACIPEVDGNPNDPLSSNYVPAAPSGLYGYPATSNSIVIAWRDNSLGETGFQIERRDFQTSFVEIGRAKANDYSFYDDSPGLVSGRTYTYRLRAFTTQTLSEYSSEASIQLP